MYNPLVDVTHLKNASADRFRFDSADPLDRVVLPDSPAVRREIAARLLAAPPKPPAPALRRRLRDWMPRLGLWLRTMPLP